MSIAECFGRYPHWGVCCTSDFARSASGSSAIFPRLLATWSVWCACSSSGPGRSYPPLLLASDWAGSAWRSKHNRGCSPCGLICISYAARSCTSSARSGSAMIWWWPFPARTQINGMSFPSKDWSWGMSSCWTPSFPWRWFWGCVSTRIMWQCWPSWLWVSYSCWRGQHQVVRLSLEGGFSLGASTGWRCASRCTRVSSRAGWECPCCWRKRGLDFTWA
jgi:hypothetical protein